MKIAIYPGTFDPITNGHLDVVKRASALFDKVYIGIAVNVSKSPLFSVEERLNLIRENLKDFENVEVLSFSGLVVEEAKKLNAVALIRGLRAVSDFEFEFQMALMNRHLAPELIPVFLMPHEKYTYLNSTIVKEVASLGGDVSDFVPENVLKALKKKFAA